MKMMDFILLVETVIGRKICRRKICKGEEIIMFINTIFEEENIGCYDCNELANVVIEMKEAGIYLCKECFEKLKLVNLFDGN